MILDKSLTSVSLDVMGVKGQVAIATSECHCEVRIGEQMWSLIRWDMMAPRNLSDISSVLLETPLCKSKNPTAPGTQIFGE